MITTTCYTYAPYPCNESEHPADNTSYSIDCYRAEGSEVSQVFNFFRQEIGMTFAFYVLHLAEKIGYQWTFFFFACMGSVLGVSLPWWS